MKLQQQNSKLAVNLKLLFEIARKFPTGVCQLKTQKWNGNPISEFDFSSFPCSPYLITTESLRSKRVLNWRGNRISFRHFQTCCTISWKSRTTSLNFGPLQTIFNSTPISQSTFSSERYFNCQMQYFSSYKYSQLYPSVTRHKLECFV